MCIVGNGCAAIEAIRALRENDFAGQIHLISNSIWPSYNPMLTTYYVAGKIDFADLFPFGYNMSFYQQYDVKLHFGSPVVELDAENKVIRNEAGCKLEYDKCLVATGARPVLPHIAGINNSRVYTMRTVEDALSLRKALQDSPKKALVVGASMVGIKVVELLYNAGLEVCLADQAANLFPLAAHPECAKIIENRLVKKGIKLRLNVALQGIEENSQGLRACFSESDNPEEADLIVLCIGVRPNLSFINLDQIKVDNGILVDDQMRTSNPDLFAAGDVAQGTNLLTGEQQIIGLWANARFQGRTAGRNMAGREDFYRGNIPHNITHFMDMTFSGLGDLNGTREEILRDEDSYTHLIWNGEQLVGVNMLGPSCSGIGIIKNALEKSLINNTHIDFDGLCSNKLQVNILSSYFNKQKV
jgi:3-phenylpropionate/trans-cinnamate dioxygenase ferredoxin reductase subunit